MRQNDCIIGWVTLFYKTELNLNISALCSYYSIKI